MATNELPEGAQKTNGETVEQPQPEGAGPQHVLSFTFAGPDSTSFRVNREGINPFQLAEVEAFLKMIVESEMMQIIMNVAQQQAASQISVPGRPMPYSRDPRKRR